MLKTVLTLCRVSNLPTVWMNVLTAALVVGQATSLPLEPGTIVLLMISLSLFYMGGMSFNDYMDRHWDTQHQTFRPIPSGKISATTALGISLALFSTAQILLLFTPEIGGFYMGFLLLAAIVIYDVIHKATPLSVVVMASARLLVYGVTAYTLTKDWVTAIWIAGGLQFIYTLLVTVVARYEHRRQQNYSIPLIPLMIAGMSILDGLVLAVLVNPWWIFVGLLAAAMTRFGQKYVRGD